MTLPVSRLNRISGFSLWGILFSSPTLRLARESVSCSTSVLDTSFEPKTLWKLSCSIPLIERVIRDDLVDRLIGERCRNQCVEGFPRVNWPLCECSYDRWDNWNLYVVPQLRRTLALECNAPHIIDPRVRQSNPNSRIVIGSSSLGFGVINIPTIGFSRPIPALAYPLQVIHFNTLALLTFSSELSY